MFRYRADWLDDRGLGSCFLRLPALTGDFGVLAAKRADDAVQSAEDPIRERDDALISSARLGLVAKYESALEAVAGSTVVTAGSADVVAGDSVPSPSNSVAGSPAWTCRGGSRTSRSLEPPRSTVPDLLLGTSSTGSAGALSVGAVKRGPRSDCSALTVIEESSAGQKRDILLLAVGAVFSLGFTVLTEAFLSWWRRRRAQDPA